MTADRWLRVARLAAQLACAGAVPAGLVVARPWPAPDLPPPPSAPVVASTPAGAIDSLDHWIVARDPFRVTRSAASVAFDPDPAPAAVEPAPPKPTLAVTGIVWGPEPSAVVEGLPGQEGSRLVRVGERIGALRIRRIAPRQVTITGMDTTWVLEVRTPW